MKMLGEGYEPTEAEPSYASSNALIDRFRHERKSGISKTFFFGTRHLIEIGHSGEGGARDMAKDPSPRSDCGQTTNQDFCRIFKQEMERLYSLALMLTGDYDTAEECFVAGFEECLEARPVFKEWGFSWCKRAIIKGAIRIVSPKPQVDGQPLSETDRCRIKLTSPLLEQISELQNFQRFVFIMSVLERYTDRDCALLLNCSLQELALGRAAALRCMAQNIGPRPTAEFMRDKTAPDVGSSPAAILVF